MIKLIPDFSTFEHPAKLTVPGVPDPVEVMIEYVYMTWAQSDQWRKDNEDKPVVEAIGGKLGEDGKTIEGGIVRGWSGVMGPDGKMVEYSLDALATLLENYQPSANELYLAWRHGLSESRVKNLGASRVVSTAATQSKAKAS